MLSISRTLSTFLALLLAFAVGLFGASSASAAPVTTVSGVDVVDLDDGRTSVTVDGEEMIVAFDETANIAHVEYSDGSTATVSLDGLDSASNSGQVDPDQEPSTVAQNSGLTCSFLMWVVGTIHTAGWGAAIAIVAASGAAGAAAVLLMYSLGASGFLAYVGSRC